MKRGAQAVPQTKKKQTREEKNNGSKNDGRAGVNVADEIQAKKLQMKFKMFSNESRSLKRKLSPKMRIYKMFRAMIVTQVPHS